MHKAALTVNSIPKVPARIQQLFFNFAKSAKCGLAGGLWPTADKKCIDPHLQKPGKLANSIFFGRNIHCRECLLRQMTNEFANPGKLILAAGCAALLHFVQRRARPAAQQRR
jgi:hypothetical protein